MPEWEGAKIPVPDGVYPIFLTGSTSEYYGVHECTVDDPYRMIQKQYILDEIKFKGAISDMYVMKKEVEKYKGDELLFHLDDDEDFGQNFFVCIKPEEAEVWIKKQEEKLAELAKKKGKRPGAAAAGGDAAAEEEDDYEEEEYVPPVSKPWPEKSETIEASQAEIAEESVVPTRERFVLNLNRRRREFAQPYKFSDRDAQEDPNIQQNDCRPYKDPNFETKRVEQSIAVQAVPESSKMATQTTWFRPVNKALQYEPITMTHRAMVEQLDSREMRDFLATIRDRYEEALQQNETVDIFSDDFADLAEDESSLGNKADSELRELQSYYHLQYCAGRLLTFIQWQPQAKGVVAVAGAKRMAFDERVAISGKVQSGYILLWNFSDPINPQYVLECPGDVHCFRFCPTNPDIVIGGLESGQVAVWSLADARAAARDLKALHDDTNEEGSANTITAQATVLSSVDQSHKRSIMDLVWLPTSFEVTDKGKFIRPKDPQAEQTLFFSIAADGLVLFWDLRKANESPEEKKEETSGGGKKQKEGWGPTAKLPVNNPEGATELSPVYALLEVPEDKSGACSIFCVTEDGEWCKIELTNPAVENFQKGVRYVIPGHYGSCVALERSLFVPNVHLSVGDWTFNIWKEGVASPLFVSPFCSCSYTCGAWSPTRAAVLFIGRADGQIDIWDLLDRSHEPSMTVSVTSASVTSMEFLQQHNRQMLAVGDDQGTVHVMEVPRNLRRASSSEKGFAANFFGREEKRVGFVERRLETLKEGGGAGDGKAEGAEPTGAAAADAKEGELTAEEKLEKDFLEMEAKFLEEMGLQQDGAAPADADE